MRVLALLKKRILLEDFLRIPILSPSTSLYVVEQYFLAKSKSIRAVLSFDKYCVPWESLLTIDTRLVTRDFVEQDLNWCNESMSGIICYDLCELKNGMRKQWFLGWEYYHTFVMCNVFTIWTKMKSFWFYW